MKRTVLNSVSLKKCLLLITVGILSLSSYAQSVIIVPTGTPAKPNLIPKDNAVTFSINPLGFGACLNSLSYSWAILNSKNDTVFTSTLSTPNYNFTKEDVYTVSLTVKTIPGGYCTANISKTATSTIKVTKLAPPVGPAGPKPGDIGLAPQPNLFSANDLGTMVSAYAMDGKGQILSGPYDYFDPFPKRDAITAALSMDDAGNFFYLPTFMNGANPLTATPIAEHGMVEVWAVDKNGDHAPVTVAKFDMNGASNTELGLYRMGLDDKGNAWILAGDGTNMYATTFKTKGTKVVNTTDVTVYNVPFESGSASDFQSGDLAFDNKGTMYVLAGSSTGTNIYTMSTNTTTPKLSKKWKVTDDAGKNFGLSVTGTVFDAAGNMYFSALDGIYFIDYDGVSAATGTAIVRKVSDNFGLMDLATSQFPVAWVPPFDGGIALPVNLTRFTGVANTGKVSLNWNVASNETGSYFELEKSYNGTSYKTAATILNTDKQGDEAYSFTDVAPFTDKVFYRLKIVNKNDAVTYSNIILFEAQTKQSSTITLYQNPVHSALNFNYTAAQNTSADITVYTYTGVKILSQKQSLQKGANSINIPLSSMLSNGLYLLEVKDGVNRQTTRFVKQ